MRPLRWSMTISDAPRTPSSSFALDVERPATDAVGRWRPWITRDEFLPSARNLAAYLALRRRDLRRPQAALMRWASRRWGASSPAWSARSTP